MLYAPKILCSAAGVYLKEKIVGLLKDNLVMLNPKSAVRTHCSTACKLFSGALEVFLTQQLSPEYPGFQCGVVRHIPVALSDTD